MTRALIVVGCLVAGALAGLAVGASAQLPPIGTGTTTSTTTTTTTTETTQTSPPPSPKPPDPAPPERLTLTVDKTDVLVGQPVVFSGRLEPMHPGFKGALVSLTSYRSRRADSDESAGQTRLNADGTFRITFRPRHNLRYIATVRDGRGFRSPEVEVFADYEPRVYWRRRSGGRLEMATILSIQAEDADWLAGKAVYFYGFRRASRVARRLARTRIFYTGEASNSRPVAYALRRVPDARRVEYVFACLGMSRSDGFGRPDDYLAQRCGRARIALPR